MRRPVTKLKAWTSLSVVFAIGCGSNQELEEAETISFASAQQALIAGNLTEAEEGAAALVQAQPESANAHELLGMTFLRQERYEEAAGMLSRTLELDPDRHRVHFPHARALENSVRAAHEEVIGPREEQNGRQRFAAAIEEYSRAADAGMHTGRAHLAMARLELEQGNARIARQRLQSTRAEIVDDEAAQRAFRDLEHALNDADARAIRRLTAALAGETGVLGALGGVSPESLGSENFGFGGLGLRGTGRGGGGPAEGTIGLGNLGTIGPGGSGTGSGYGRGAGRLSGRSARIPRVRAGRLSVRGSLPSEVVRRVIRRHINELRFCYEQGLNTDASLAGDVTLHFVIYPGGAVHSARSETSTLGNASVENCLVSAVRRWTFPTPEGGGAVTVDAPFSFTSGDESD